MVNSSPQSNAYLDNGIYITGGYGGDGLSGGGGGSVTNFTLSLSASSLSPSEVYVAAGLSIQERHQEQDGDFNSRDTDPAPERRIADQFLQSQEVPRRFGRIRWMADVHRLLERRHEAQREY